MSMPVRQLDLGSWQDRLFRKRRVADGLLALQEWPQSLKGCFADAADHFLNGGEDFNRFKIATFSGLIDGRTGKGWPDCHRTALLSLLEAYSIFDIERPDNVPASLTLLIGWPDMFGSRIITHFSTDHESRFTPEAFSSFQNRLEEQHGDETYAYSAQTGNPFEVLGVPLPDDMEMGGYVLTVTSKNDFPLREGFWSVMKRDDRLSHRKRLGPSSRADIKTERAAT